MKYGQMEDIEAIEAAVCSGIKGIFTAHGSSMQDLKLNPALNSLIKQNYIERVIFLEENNKGEVASAYALNIMNLTYEKIG